MLFCRCLPHIRCTRVGYKNETELADLTNPYTNQGGFSFLTPYSTTGAYPTASVNGTLAIGEIKSI